MPSLLQLGVLGLGLLQDGGFGASAPAEVNRAALVNGNEPEPGPGAPSEFSRSATRS